MRILFGENLIWRFFTIRQTAKLKSSPNFPAIRYYPEIHTSTSLSNLYIYFFFISRSPGLAEWNTPQGAAGEQEEAGPLLAGLPGNGEEQEEFDEESEAAQKLKVSHQPSSIPASHSPASSCCDSHTCIS